MYVFESKNFILLIYMIQEITKKVNPCVKTGKNVQINNKGSRHGDDCLKWIGKDRTVYRRLSSVQTAQAPGNQSCLCRFFFSTALICSVFFRVTA